MPMNIGGVFVGVSSQEDPRIPSLRYAARDAERLGAVFADAAEQNGGDPELIRILTNQGATTADLTAALEDSVALSRSQPFDLFVVHLSCHGLPDGQVVLYDGVYDEGGHRAFPLARVHEILAGLQTGTLVVTLDICFGGTALGLDGSANRDALQAMLEGLARKNGAIAWAAGADEPAHESHRKRHGYLTMGLLGSLERARESGRREVSAITWLDEAMAIARDEALQLGRPQTPRMASLLGPDAMIPVPALGPKQLRLVESEGITPVRADLGGLEQYGFPDSTVAAIRTKIQGSVGLNDLQLRAIAPAGLLVGRNILVRAPTSAGKTLVAELAVLRAFHQGLKSVMLVPTRALAAEHARILSQTYRGIGLRVIRSAGDASDDDDLLMRGHFDTAVLTYEKFGSLVYRDVSVLDGVRLVVLDEAQLIQDEGRGRTAELLLALLQRRKQRGLPIQLVALCGDFADLGGFPEWLVAELVAVQERPVPLHESIIAPDGSFTATWRDQRGVETGALDLRLQGGEQLRPHMARERLAELLVARLTAEGKQVLVFRSLRSKVRAMARRLAELLPEGDYAALVRRFEDACQHHEHSRITEVLRTCLSHGVGFHSSELEEHERAFLEAAFRDRQIRVLVSTTTLASGVNLPANAVVVIDHSFWRGPNVPEVPLGVADYRNMVGRAGRVGQGMDSGEAYLIAGTTSERTTLARTYLGGTGARLGAGLGSMGADDRTLAAATVVGRGSLLEYVGVLSNTFWGYQNRHDPAWRERLRQETDESLERLSVLGLLSRVESREYSLTQAGAACAIFGVAVVSAKRIIATVDEMIAASEEIGRDEILALTQLSLELDAFYIPRGENDTVATWLPRLGAWGRDRPVLMRALQAPQDEDPDFDVPLKRLKRVAIIRNWLSGRPVNEVEAALGGAANEPALNFVREAARRTSDLLPAVAALIANRQPERREELNRLVEDLRPALEFGTTVAAGALQRLRLGLTRKQALLLAQEGITTVEGLEDALKNKSNRLEQVLTTPVVNEIRAILSNGVLRRRRSAPQVGDANLNLFPDGPLS